MTRPSLHASVFSLLFALSLKAELYEWGNVGTDWATPANWITNGAVSDTTPGVDDIASFGTDAVANQPVLSSAAAVLGLVIDDAYNEDWQIGGAGNTLIIGPNGIAKTGQRGPTIVEPDVVLDGSQTWYAENNETYVRLHILQVNGSLAGVGDLDLEWRGGGEFRWFIGDGSTRAPGDVDFNGSVRMILGGTLQYDLGLQSANGTYVFGGTVGAPGTISIDDSTFRLKTAGDSSGLTNTFVNGFDVGPDGCVLAWEASGTAPTIDVQGDVLMGGPVAIGRVDSTPQPLYTGTWSLKQTGGATCGLFVQNPGYPLPAYTFGGELTDEAGAFANPLVMLMIQSDFDLTTPAADSTYANGTIVDYCGFPYKDGTQQARIDVAPASGLGTGGLTVLPGGKLKLGAASNIEAGQPVLIQEHDVCVGVVSVGYDGMPDIDAASSGVFGIDETFTGSIDLSTLGDGGMFLGSTDGGTFDGATIAVGNGNTWRLGAGGGLVPALSISAADVLRGNGDLQVGRAGWHGRGNVLLSQTNSFSGRIDVSGMSYYNRDPQVAGSGSVLQGNARAGGSPFGDTNGVVYLQNSTLWVNQGESSPDPVHKEQLVFDGRSRLYMNCNTIATTMSFGEIVRTNRGCVTIYDQRSSLAVLEQIHVTDPPAEVNGILPAWIVHERGPHFVTHGANGFEDFAGYAADITTSGASDVVNSADNTVAGAASCYALKNTDTLDGGGTISIGAGGLILGGAISCNLGFGANEGVIYAGSTSEISGDIAGSGGLTACGNRLNIRGTKTFSGPVTVNGCAVWVSFDSEGAGGSLGDTNNAVFLNGGALVGFDGDRLLASRTITLGPAGGMISRYTVYSKITGSGMLMTGAGSNSGTLTVANPGNDYSGGTLLLSGAGDRSSGNIVATVDGSLGPGDLTVGPYLAATLQGDGNIHSNATVQVALGGLVEFESASPSIGGLAGGGKVELGTGSQPTALAIGGTDISSTFYGRIVETDAGNPGSITKTRSGTLMLYGVHEYTGDTIVDAGKLTLMGSVASNLTVNAAGALGGLGVVGGNLAVNGTLDIVLRGDSDYDFFSVGGNADLAGATLTVTLTDGYAPDPNTEWQIILPGGSVSGSFADVPDGYIVEEVGGNVVLRNPPQGTLLLVR